MIIFVVHIKCRTMACIITFDLRRTAALRFQLLIREGNRRNPYLIIKDFLEGQGFQSIEGTVYINRNENGENACEACTRTMQNFITANEVFRNFFHSCHAFCVIGDPVNLVDTWD